MYPINWRASDVVPPIKLSARHSAFSFFCPRAPPRAHSYRQAQAYVNMAEEIHTGHSPDLETAREHGMNVHKRQARVTVKYNRKQLQKRLDVEKWIEEGLENLYEGKVSVHAHHHRCS